MSEHAKNLIVGLIARVFIGLAIAMAFGGAWS